MSEKYEKTCKYLNYVEHLLILVSTVTGCVSISAFASLDVIPVGITSFPVGIQICAITAGIKKYKSIIKKKKKKHDKIVFIGKAKLNTIAALIYKALIDSDINHGKFVSINALREYYEMKEEIKNSETSVEYFCGTSMETYCVSCKKYTANENSRVQKTIQNRLMFLSNCAVCGKKKLTFIKNKELRNFND